MNYIKLLLKKIAICKEILVQDVEMGQEVFIPKELSQNDLPQSMKYYDPILQIITDNISDDKREYFYTNMKNKY